MMEGCWILDSDFTLYDVRTGEPAPVTSWRVCFDANGHGQQTLKFSNGFQCHSAIAAKFRNAQELALDDMQDVPCNNSKRILRSISVCRLNSENKAICISKDTRGSGSDSNVKLRREG